MAKNTPNKRKFQKSNKIQSPKKQKNPPKQSPKNGVTKAKNKKSPPKPKLNLIPDDIIQTLSRKQKKTAILRLVQALKSQGTEDLSTVNKNDASYKETVNKIVTELKNNKAQKTGETEVQTPKKSKTPKKTPKKSPKTKSD